MAEAKYDVQLMELLIETEKHPNFARHKREILDFRLRLIREESILGSGDELKDILMKKDVISFEELHNKIIKNSVITRIGKSETIKVTDIH